MVEATRVWGMCCRWKTEQLNPSHPIDQLLAVRGITSISKPDAFTAFYFWLFRSAKVLSTFWTMRNVMCPASSM